MIYYIILYYIILYYIILYYIILILIYLLTVIVKPPGGSNTVHIFKQTAHRTTQLTIWFGRLSGIRTQSGQNKIN